MRRSIKKGIRTPGESFFSMKANPNGASIGNFVTNVKELPGAFISVGKSLASGVRMSGGRKVKMNKK